MYEDVAILKMKYIFLGDMNLWTQLYLYPGNIHQLVQHLSQTKLFIYALLSLPIYYIQLQRRVFFFLFIFSFGVHSTQLKIACTVDPQV